MHGLKGVPTVKMLETSPQTILSSASRAEAGV